MNDTTENSKQLREQSTRAMNSAGEAVTAAGRTFFLLIAVFGEAITRSGARADKWLASDHKKMQLNVVVEK